MNEPDVGKKVAESGAEALEKTEADVLRWKAKDKAIPNRSPLRFCPRNHGMIAHRLESGMWGVVTCNTNKLLWTRKPEPPVKCPLCERE